MLPLIFFQYPTTFSFPDFLQSLLLFCLTGHQGQLRVDYLDPVIEGIHILYALTFVGTRGSECQQTEWGSRPWGLVSPGVCSWRVCHLGPALNKWASKACYWRDPCCMYFCMFHEGPSFQRAESDDAVGPVSLCISAVFWFCVYLCGWLFVYTYTGLCVCMPIGSTHSALLLLDLGRRSCWQLHHCQSVKFSNSNQHLPPTAGRR